MLTATQRRANYTAQAGADPDTWTRRLQDRASAEAAGLRHLPPLPGTGPQRRRDRHKTRRHGAAPARLAASAARQAGAGERAMRLDERARLFLGNHLGRKREGNTGPARTRGGRVKTAPRLAMPWADRRADVAGDLRRAGDR